LPLACNWAVGSFALASIAAHEFCRRRRAKELSGIKEAVDLMNDLKIKKKKERELASKAQEEAARAAEEERQRKSWTNLANYKFW
jgi:cytochrome c oxidase assembly protein subunit 20